MQAELSLNSYLAGFSMERSVIHLVSSSIAGAIVYGGSLLLAPSAQAGTLTFGYSNGSFDATATGNAFIIQAVNSLFGQNLPNSIAVNGSNLQGVFTVLDDPAQFQDGDITIDYAFLDTIFGSYIDSFKTSLPGLAGLSDAQQEAALDAIFDYSLTGTGTLSNTNGGSTNFAVNYINTSNSIVINGFDTTIATSCLTLICTTNASGTFGLTASPTGVIALASLLSGQPLPPQVNAILPSLGLSSSPLLTGNFNYGVTTSLLSANPTGTTLSGDLTDGTITTTRNFASGATTISTRNLAAIDNIQDVPEPATGLALLGAGIANIWKRRRKAA
jgi:hypothetical protein